MLLNWSTPTIVAASEIELGDRLKRPPRYGSIVRKPQYLVVVRVTRTDSGVTLSTRDLDTGARKNEHKNRDANVTVYR